MRDVAGFRAGHVAKCVRIAGGNAHWQGVSPLWQVPAIGDREWGMPAHNGGLLSSVRFPFKCPDTVGKRE